MTSAARQIDLRIDRVVLDGLPLTASERDLFRAGLEAELGRLLTERGLPGGGTRTSLAAHPPAMAPLVLSGTVAERATAVAGHVYERISQVTR